MDNNSNKRIPCTMNRTWAEIDLDSAEFNFHVVKKALMVHSDKTKICCVVKANAYGHSAVTFASLYQRLNADYLAVSNIQEALQLRKFGIHLPILILGYTSCDCAQILAENNITQSVFSYDYGMLLSQKAQESNVLVKVHIKMDTGMGRIGFLCRDGCNDDLDEVLNICKAPCLDIEGIFTHFAVADEGIYGEAYTRKQFQNFLSAISKLESANISFKIKHCANSAAILDYPEFHLDMVRAGVILYGLSPSEDVKNSVNLKPVMSLHSVIAHLKIVYPGQSVSYGRRYTATSIQRVATIPIGYADGFRRISGNKTYRILINNKTVPIIGRVCMDQLMVDVTGTDCTVGDEVVIFGYRSPCTADDLAKVQGTINYEIVCGVGERIPRAFIKDNTIIKWEDKIGYYQNN